MLFPLARTWSKLVLEKVANKDDTVVCLTPTLSK